MATCASSAIPTRTTYARYIGRVGALAVALGIGAAVATTPGIAWAAPESEASETDNVGTTTPGADTDIAGSPDTGLPTGATDARSR